MLSDASTAVPVLWVQGDNQESGSPVSMFQPGEEKLPVAHLLPGTVLCF